MPPTEFVYFWKNAEGLRAYWRERTQEIRFFAKFPARISARAEYHRRLYGRREGAEVVDRERRVHAMPRSSLIGLAFPSQDLFGLGLDLGQPKDVQPYLIKSKTSEHSWTFNPLHVAVALDYLLENNAVWPEVAEPPKVSKGPEYRRMTADEHALALELDGCSFTPGSFDKRFARNLGGEARSPTGEGSITERQAGLLLKMVTRYRRQIRPGAIPGHLHHLLVAPPKQVKR